MEKDIIEYQVNNVKNGDNNDERFERNIEYINQSPNNNSVNSESALENNNSSNNNGSDVVNSPNTNNVATSNQINNIPLFGNRNNLSKNGISNNIDNVGSKALQKMGVPKGISDKAIKKNGGTFSPTNLPGNKMVSNFARNKLDKMMSSKNKDGLAERLGSSMGKRALSAINPALGVATNSLDKNENNKKNELSNYPSNSYDNSNLGLNNSSNNGDGIFSFSGDSSKKVKVFAILGSSSFLFVTFICIITICSFAFIKIGGLKLSDDVKLDDSNLQNTLEKDSGKMTEKGFDADINDSAYVDIYNDEEYVDAINVTLVAKDIQIDFDNMSSLFGGNTECDPDSGNCIEGADKRFFLKMYDLYYLYLTKYNVKLDLTLIMATLTYNSNDLPETFTKNLSFYNRKLLVESDWNPTEMVGLEWDYDYQSLYKSFNYKHYIFANDSAFDMQLLAKNMVSKTTEQSCVKTNEEDNSKVTTKSKKIKDNEDDLVCDEGEELVKGNSTYTLDMDKYDNFLLEYIEKKSYYKVNSIIPYYFTGFDEVYQTDKVPSVINRIKKKSTSSSSSTNNGSNDDVINSIKNDSPSTSSLITTSGGFKGNIHYYNQGNYSDYSFGGYGSIQSHGCGPTSLAIVISSLLNEEHDPVEVTNKLCELGGCTDSGATLWGITSTAEAYGMKVDYNSNTQDVVNALKSGNALVVAITNGGLIISDGVQLSYGGHYIVLTGVDSNGQITIADPGNSANNSRTLDIEALSRNSNNRPESPSFWIITK